MVSWRRAMPSGKDVSGILRFCSFASKGYFYQMKKMAGFIAIIVLTACQLGVNENQDSAKNSIAENDTPARAAQVVKTRLFKGAWFDINYPENFTAEPSLTSATNPEGYESAVFTSPDGDVAFYIFSPQWSGEATDIAIRADEKLISKDSVYTPEKRSTIFHWTIEANDKSYRRSYQEVRMDENINWIFGIKYKNEAAYDKYKEQYLAFKNSIIQYGD